jgi:hypothetical protein
METREFFISLLPLIAFAAAASIHFYKLDSTVAFASFSTAVILS